MHTKVDKVGPKALSLENCPLRSGSQDKVGPGGIKSGQRACRLIFRHFPFILPLQARADPAPPVRFSSATSARRPRRRYLEASELAQGILPGSRQRSMSLSKAPAAAPAVKRGAI